MTRDKTPTQELVWLYSRKQASLLTDLVTAENLQRHGDWHIDAAECPCLPWDDCQCPCHLENMMDFNPGRSYPHS